MIECIILQNHHQSLKVTLGDELIVWDFLPRSPHQQTKATYARSTLTDGRYCGCSPCYLRVDCAGCGVRERLSEAAAVISTG